MQPFPTIQNYGYTYQQPYQDRLTQLQNQYQQTAPQPINQGLLWVSGEVGAKSYLVAPNSTVLLMDSDSQRFYLKSADVSGMPSMRIFEYNEVTNTPSSVVSAPNRHEKELDNKYVTREEYEGLKRQYESIMQRLDSINNVADVEQPKSKSRKGTGNEQPDI